MPPKPTEDVYALVMSRVEKTDTCWLWTGPPTTYGYGKVTRRYLFVHRVAYEHHKGPIPAGLTIDHLCGIRRCVNPEHLEAVTRGENTLRSPTGITAVNARKTHCKWGHPLVEANIYRSPGRPTRRRCRICRSEEHLRLPSSSEGGC